MKKYIFLLCIFNCCRPTQQTGELLGVSGDLELRGGHVVWTLSELDGKPYVYNENDPRIVFWFKGDSVKGYGPCSTFAGTFTEQEKHLRLSINLKSTRCETTETERQVQRRLETADHYAIDKRILYLKQGNKRFAKLDGAIITQY